MISIPRHRIQAQALALAAILILAAILRMGAPDIFEFKRDEANLSHLSLEFARGHALPLLGISSSVGVPNSPVSVYILTLPYLVTSDPQLATQFVALLNVLAVLFTYLLVRRYYGAGPALLAALVYAVSPWAVIYSRKIWAQNLLPPFALLTLLATLAGWVDGRRWGQWLSLPLLSLTAQIHYSGVTLILPVIYLLWHFRARTTRAFAGGLILALLTCLPFAVGLLQATLPRLDDLQALRSTDQSAPTGLHLTAETLHFAALTIAGTEIHALAGPQAFLDYLATVPDAYPLLGLITWGVAAGAVWLIVRTLRARDRRRHIDAMLLIGAATPIALFSVTWTRPYPHYLIIMLPLAYIILGVAARDAWHALKHRQAARRVIFALAGGALSVILLLQGVMSVRLLDFVAATPTPDGFGVPFTYLRPIREAILSASPQAVVAHLDGQRIGIDEDASVWSFLLYDIPTRQFIDDSTGIYPSGEALRLEDTCHDPDAQHFPLRTGEGCYQVRDARALTPPTHEPLGVALANGVAFIGYQWSADACLTLVWTPGTPDMRDYSFLVHFTGADGSEILTADGLSLLSRYWRADDTLTRTFCVSSDDAAAIRGVNLGMYAYDDGAFHNIDVLDAAGAPAGHSFHIEF